MMWAQGIFTFNPEAVSYVMDAHPVFKLHLFLGLTIFVIFPFTRLVHMLSVPIRYLWRPGVPGGAVPSRLARASVPAGLQPRRLNATPPLKGRGGGRPSRS